MDLYTFASKTASELGLKINQATKERLISTLRVAGYLKIENETDERIAKKIFEDHAKKLQIQEGHLSFRGATTKESSPKEKFQELKQLNEKGLCGNCRQPTETTKLSDGEEVNYCDACRATLWKEGQ